MSNFDIKTNAKTTEKKFDKIRQDLGVRCALLRSAHPALGALLDLDVANGRLLVSHVGLACRRATHDPHHEKVADRRGSSHGVGGLHVFAFGCVLPAGGSHGATSLVFSNSTLTIEFENRMQDSACNRCMHKKQCEAN